MKKIICLIIFIGFSCQDLSYINLQNKSYQNIGEGSEIKLEILPTELRNVLFIATESWIENHLNDPNILINQALTQNLNPETLNSFYKGKDEEALNILTENFRQARKKVHDILTPPNLSLGSIGISVHYYNDMLDVVSCLLKSYGQVKDDKKISLLGNAFFCYGEANFEALGTFPINNDDFYLKVSIRIAIDFIENIRKKFSSEPEISEFLSFAMDPFKEIFSKNKNRRNEAIDSINRGINGVKFLRGYIDKSLKYLTDMKLQQYSSTLDEAISYLNKRSENMNQDIIEFIKNLKDLRDERTKGYLRRRINGTFI